MRGPAGINDSIQQKQRNSLLILRGVEDHICAIRVVPCAGIFRLDLYGAVEKLGAACEIEGMEPLVICGATLRHSNDIDHTVRSGFRIDDGS